MTGPEEPNNQDRDQIEVIEIPGEESDTENFLVTEQLQKMPGIFSHGLFFLILILVCVALLYSVIGKIDIVVENRAVARPESDKMRILSDRSGFIDNIYISEGKVVQENAPLYLIRPRDIPSCEAKMKVGQQGAPLGAEPDMPPQSSVNGFVIESSAHKSADRSLSPGSDGACRMIRSQHSGTVSEIYFRNRGEYIKEFDLLCTILPLNSPLYMDIIVSNEDIGFLEEGMPIKYKFDAFPFIDYGILEGRILFISPSAVEDSERGFVYHLRGSLDQLHFTIRGKEYPVKAGMTATAEIVTGQKNIFSVLFMKRM